MVSYHINRKVIKTFIYKFIFRGRERLRACTSMRERARERERGANAIAYCMEVSGQLKGLSYLLPPCGSRGSKSLSLMAGPMPAEPSSWLQISYLQQMSLLRDRAKDRVLLYSPEWPRNYINRAGL